MNYSLTLLTSRITNRIFILSALISLTLLFLSSIFVSANNYGLEKTGRNINNIQAEIGFATIGTPITDIWINEFHYDNIGTDADEFVELAGKAGLDLTGCSIVLYNGTNGTSYATVNLSGTIPDEGNGFGAISFVPSSFQNGSPDGIALVNNVNVVLEFISYEGIIVAYDGSANGMTSTDIGVEESNSTTAAGHSLQKVGAGCEASDFTWINPSASSQGLINTEQYINITPSVSLIQSTSSIIENGGSDTIIAKLSNIACSDVTVNLELNGASTATGSGTDFGLSSSVITILVGDTIGKAVLTAVGDSEYEGNELAIIDISSVTNGTENGNQQITCTILDDDVVVLNPELSISEPSLSITSSDSVSYILAYSNVSVVSLGVADISVNASGTANGDISINELSDTSRLITISNITGDGSLGISIAEGSAQNISGVLAPEAGPSSTFIVDNTSPTMDCEPMEVRLNAYGNALIAVENIDNGTTDENGMANLFLSRSNFDCSDIGVSDISSTVWINELHYDNSSTDVGEFVEIAGTAGTNLSGYEVILYNGSNSEEYGNITLSGNIPDEGDGYGALAFLKSGIQNGNPDGLALVNDVSVVLEFISYGGVITAADGPALGLSSVYMEVEESGSSPVGFSLQKIGVGSESSDFSWTGFSNDSPGIINSGQTITGNDGVPIYLIAEDIVGNMDSCKAYVKVIDDLPPMVECQDMIAFVGENGKATITAEMIDNASNDACGPLTITISESEFDCEQIKPKEALWINEFHYDNASDDLNEFVEIAGTAGTDLNGFYIYLYNGSNGEYYDTIAISGIIPDEIDGYGALSFSIPDIQNGPDGIALIEAKHYVLDFISYEGDLIATNGPAAGIAALNIEVSESSSTQVGFSLQKTGSGAKGSQFSWDDPKEDSPGQLNTNQQIDATSSYTVTMYVEDGNGNMDSCTSNVIVKDTMTPTAVCQNTVVYLDENGNTTLTLGMIDGGSTDNCEIFKSRLDITDLSCENLGGLTVWLTSEDISGNTNSCSAFVEVYDTISPIIKCKDIDVNLWENGEYVLSPSDQMEIVDGTADNCTSFDDLDFVISNISFACANVNNPDTVRIEVSDDSHNVAFCYTVVKVDDVTKPIITCKNLEVELDSRGMAIIYPVDILDSIVFENCEIVAMELDTNFLFCNDIGVNRIKLTAYDAAGNYGWCRSKVTIVNNVAPVFTPIADVAVELVPGICSTTIDYPARDAADACKDSLTYTLIEGLGEDGDFPLGVTVETWVASDSGGNKDTVSFNVTVTTYNAAPEIDPIDDVVVDEDPVLLAILLTGIGVGNDCDTQIVDSILVTTSDNTLITNIAVIYADGDTTGRLQLTIAPNRSGSAMVTVTIMDNGGTASGGVNTTVETFIVTVNPVNDTPFVVDTIPDVVVIADHVLTVPICSELKEIFDDMDGDVLTLAVTLVNGDPLPDWLTYTDGVLSGAPIREHIGSYDLKVTASDATNASAIDEFQVCVVDWSTVSKDFKNLMGVNMFPNPTNGKVSIEISGNNGSDVEVVVMDITGKEVLRKEFKTTSSIQLDMSKHVSGMYFVKVNVDGIEVVKKLILNRK